MLKDNKYYTTWQTKRTAKDAPTDEMVLDFYLTQYGQEFVTSNSKIFHELEDKIIHNNLGAHTHRSSTYYFTLKGIAFLKTDDLDPAVENLKKAIDLDDQNTFAHYQLAKYYKDPPRYAFELAVTHFYKFFLHCDVRRDYDQLSSLKHFSLTPQLSVIAIERAEELASNNDLNEAVNYLSLAKIFTPRDNVSQKVAILKKRGQVHLKREQQYCSDALADFGKSIKLVKKHLQSQPKLLGELHKLKGDAERLNDNIEIAVVHYDQAQTYLHEDPMLSDVIESRGECYKKMKQYKKALADFKKSAELNPESHELKEKIKELKLLASPQKKTAPEMSLKRKREERKTLTLALEPSQESEPAPKRSRSEVLPAPAKSSQASQLPFFSLRKSGSQSSQKSTPPKDSPHAWQSIPSFSHSLPKEDH